MKKLDASEADLLTAYEKGELKTTSPIASVLHKYASGRLVEKPSSLAPRSTGRADKRRTG